MKNLKVVLFALALMVGVGSAYAYKVVANCTSALPVFTKAVQTETFAGAGAIASDQTIGNYVALSGVSYECLETSDLVCTYTFDDSAPVGQKIKQCTEGINDRD